MFEHLLPTYYRLSEGRLSRYTRAELPVEELRGPEDSRPVTRHVGCRVAQAFKLYLSRGKRLGRLSQEHKGMGNNTGLSCEGSGFLEGEGMGN